MCLLSLKLAPSFLHAVEFLPELLRVLGDLFEASPIVTHDAPRSRPPPPSFCSSFKASRHQLFSCVHQKHRLCHTNHHDKFCFVSLETVRGCKLKARSFPDVSVFHQSFMEAVVFVSVSRFNIETVQAACKFTANPYAAHCTLYKGWKWCFNTFFWHFSDEKVKFKIAFPRISLFKSFWMRSR